MKKRIYSMLVASAILVSPFQVFSAERLYVYPKLGQTDQQQEDDRYHCHLWARDATGFDPLALSVNSQPEYVQVPVPENPQSGATGKGLLGGAIAGAAIGEIDSDNPGKGAAIGAVVGAIVGSMVEHEGERESHEQALQEANTLRQDRREIAVAKANYRRALCACLEGRGYSVN